MIIKASSERVRLDRLLASQEKTVQEAFDRFLSIVSSESVLKEIGDALESRNEELVFRIINSHIVAFANIVPTVVLSVGVNETRHIVETQLKTAATGISFDITYPRAAEATQRARFDLIRGLTLQQRQATQQAIVNAFQETGFAPRQISRAIVQSIGLTARQEQAVRNYRNLLATENADALERQLRDRRFDRTVAASVRDKTPIPANKIDQMVDAYRKNFLKFRAETIARTQGLQATSMARQESLVQIMEALPDTHEARRVWNITHDHRTRDAHVLMDQQDVGIDEPFVDGDGNALMFPGDPSAPAETTIKCRCNFTVKIVEKVRDDI